MKDTYEDIINLPNPNPKNHIRMSMMARAAQFAPFAALSGHDDAIKETARLTETIIESEENTNELLDRTIREIIHVSDTHPLVSVTFYVPDSMKSGGKYEHFMGNIKKVDEYYKLLIFDNEMKIDINTIIDLNILN